MRELEIGDFVDNEKITHITALYYFFDKKKVSKKRINQGNYFFKYKKSPNIEIDWTSAIDVYLNYYELFDKWSTYMCNGDKSYKIVQLEIKNNQVFYENEYWLPAPVCNNVHDWNSKDLTKLKDGIYNVTLYKKQNSWYGHEKNVISLNLYRINSKLVNNLENLKCTNRDSLYGSVYNDCVNIRYESNYRTGLTLWYDSLDLIKLFKERYIISKTGGVQIILTDNEIYKIINPIKNRIEKIIKKAIDNSNYIIDDYESYGEYTLNYIKFDKTISNQIFDKIDNRLKYYKIKEL